ASFPACGFWRLSSRQRVVLSRRCALRPHGPTPALASSQTPHLYSAPDTFMNTSPLCVAVTGAAGQIGYALLFRIASGALLGPKQPVILHLIEIEPALPALNGVVMELEDGAFPLLKGVVATANLEAGFRGVNWALLVGSVPRKQGMERKDLL